MRYFFLCALMTLSYSCDKDRDQEDLSPQFKLMGGESLSGSWENSCVSNEDDDFKLQISFSGGKYFNKTRNTYISEGCEELGHTTTVTGSYELFEDADYQSNINFEISEVNIVPKNEEVAELFNSISFCGLNDWQTNQLKSFREGSCGPAQGHKVINAGISVVGDGLKIRVKLDEANEQFSNEVYRRTNIAH